MAGDYGKIFDSFPRTDGEKQGICVEADETEDLRIKGVKMLGRKAGGSKENQSGTFQEPVVSYLAHGG
jgi:hypothetical protein